MERSFLSCSPQTVWAGSNERWYGRNDRFQHPRPMESPRRQIARRRLARARTGRVYARARQGGGEDTRRRVRYCGRHRAISVLSRRDQRCAVHDMRWRDRKRTVRKLWHAVSLFASPRGLPKRSARARLRPPPLRRLQPRRRLAHRPRPQRHVLRMHGRGPHLHPDAQRNSRFSSGKRAPVRPADPRAPVGFAPNHPVRVGFRSKPRPKKDG